MPRADHPPGAFSPRTSSQWVDPESLGELEDVVQRDVPPSQRRLHRVAGQGRTRRLPRRPVTGIGAQHQPSPGDRARPRLKAANEPCPGTGHRRSVAAAGLRPCALRRPGFSAHGRGCPRLSRRPAGRRAPGAGLVRAREPHTQPEHDRRGPACPAATKLRSAKPVSVEAGSGSRPVHRLGEVVA